MVVLNAHRTTQKAVFGALKRIGEEIPINTQKALKGRMLKKGTQKMAKKIIEHDGQYYSEGQTIWDLGSFECVDGQDMNQRNYEGLSADIDKLPKYDNLEAGSTAFCLDTGDFYKYHAKTKTWYKV